MSMSGISQKIKRRSVSWPKFQSSISDGWISCAFFFFYFFCLVTGRKKKNKGRFFCASVSSSDYQSFKFCRIKFLLLCKICENLTWLLPVSYYLHLGVSLGLFWTILEILIMTVLLDLECDWPFIPPEVTEKELKSSSTNRKTTR